MEWLEIKTVFESDNTRLSEDLIAEAYRDTGIDGLVIEDPDMAPEEDWADPRPPAPERHSVSGYLPCDPAAADRIKALESRLQLLAGTLGFSFSLQTVSIAEADWAEVWKEHFHPVKIAEHIVIKPSWRTYEASENDIVIELDPGMAFGTGTHPTTAMCVRLIRHYLHAGEDFCDIGTGSGILMIAAARLGAARLWGSDISETAVAVARENLRKNRVDPARASVITGDLAEGVTRPCHVAVANITPQIILKLLPDVPRILQPGGRFICSGFLEHDIALLVRKMEAKDLAADRILTKDGWGAIGAVRS